MKSQLELLRQIEAAILTDMSWTVKVEINEGEKIQVSRAAGNLITQLYAVREDTQSSLMPALERIARGEGAKAIGMKGLGDLFPDDFEGVGDLLVPMGGEISFAKPMNLFGDDRKSQEIVRDDNVVAEWVLRKYRLRSGGSRLVIGKGPTRRRWIGLGQEFGVGPFGGGWEPGNPPEGEDIFEPFGEAANLDEEIKGTRQSLETRIASIVEVAERRVIELIDLRPNSPETKMRNEEEVRRLKGVIRFMHQVGHSLEEGEPANEVAKPAASSLILLLEDFEKVAPGTAVKIVNTGLGIVILSVAALFDSIIPAIGTASVMATGVYGSAAVNGVLEQLKGWRDGE